MENGKLNGFNDGLHPSSGIGGGQSASEMMAEMNKKPFKLPYHWCVKVGFGMTPAEVYEWAQHGTWWGAETNNTKGGEGYINQYGFWTKEKDERDTLITLEQFIEFVIPNMERKKGIVTDEFKAYDEYQRMFVPHDLAVKLKAKGFDARCIYSYYQDGTIGSEIGWINYNQSEKLVSRPTYQQVADWLRIRYKLATHVFQEENFDAKRNRTYTGNWEWELSQIGAYNAPTYADFNGVNEEYYECWYQVIERSLTLIPNKK